jgi:hypothetical protein
MFSSMTEVAVILIRFLTTLAQLVPCGVQNFSTSCYIICFAGAWRLYHYTIRNFAAIEISICMHRLLLLGTCNI